MNLHVFLAVFLLCLADVCLSKEAAPKVQIYSRKPGRFGEDNILICHASGFHPPELDLDLLMDGEVMPNTVQTDLAFEENWYYHLTKHANFTPEKGPRYTCRVTHLGKTSHYHWEPDM